MKAKVGWMMRCALVAGALLYGQPVLMAAPNDEASVRAVLMAQFDKPDARLVVEPVVVVGTAAVASWAQQERGGRALLFRGHGQWRIAACGGEAFRDARVLQEAGVAAKDARALVRALIEAEAKLPPAQRAKFATFEGIVPIDASGSHPAPAAHAR